MSAFHPILNEAYARQRIADYRRRQAALNSVQKEERPSHHVSRVPSILSKRLEHILAWNA